MLAVFSFFHFCHLAQGLTSKIAKFKCLCLLNGRISELLIHHIAFRVKKQVHGSIVAWSLVLHAVCGTYTGVNIR